MREPAHSYQPIRPLPRSLLVARDYFPPQVGGISTMMARVMTDVAPGDVICLTASEGEPTVETPEGRSRVYRTMLPFRLPTPIDSLVLGGVVTALRLRHGIRVLLLATEGEGYIGLLAHRLLGTPFVIFAHGNEVLALRDAKWPRGLESLRAASAVIANSRYTAGLLTELGVDAERVRVIHPGCDPQQFQPLEVDASARSRLLGGHSPNFVLLTVGNLVERKGHDLALQAVANLRKSIPNLLYVIAGAGRYEDTLRRLANELGVADCVLFKGRVSAEDLPALYSCSDLFLMPSRLRAANNDVEGFGIVYLEASACGRPVIGGLSGGIEDAVLNEKTGLLVDPGDPVALERAVRRLWADPGLRASMGAAGRARVVAELTWSHFGAQVRATLHDCVDALTPARNPMA